MGVTVTNLIQGPATLYHGAFGVTEPATLATNPSTGWTDLGGTQDGVTLTVELTYKELEVDQVVEVPGQTLVKRVAKIATNLAEATLENWARALNEAVPTDGVLEPAGGTAAMQPLYTAWLLDGLAPNGERRRVIIRRGLQLGNVGSPYKKDGQTLIPIEVGAHYVSSSIKAFKILDPDPTP